MPSSRGSSASSTARGSSSNCRSTMKRQIALYERAGFEITATIEDLPRTTHLMARWTGDALA